MKEQNIRVTYVPIDTITVQGQPRHFFDNEQGRFRAILADDLPRPLGKGEKLEILMNCSDRLDRRLEIEFAAYQRDSSPQVRLHNRKKVKALYKAKTRVSKKITDLVCGG